MKYGMLFANVGPFGHPEVAAELGAICEETGIESVWTVEHVVVPGGYASQYPYAQDGRMAGGDDAPIPDPLVWLTWVGAHTTALRLATGILILPQRNPVVLAKEVATLDQLSQGRVILGIGVGWLEEEFDALGVPFADRGARTDEHVEVLRALWSGGAIDFDGRFTQLRAANSFPHPAQSTVPIVVGGHSKAAARRAGRLGDGFFPGKGDFAELETEMRRAAEEAGRDPDAIEITRGGAMDRDAVARMADEGCDRFVIPPLAFDPAKLRDRLARFADEVITKVA
jgi:probable F420-dependent oxidoreductase